MFVGISAGRRGGLITKVPFTKDASGRILQRCLGMLGLSLSDEYSVKPKLVNCYVTNLVKGTILGETGKNRKPTADEVAYWLPALREEVMNVEPRRILALGKQVYDSIQPEFSHVIPLRHPRWFQSHGAIKAGSSAFKEMMKHYECAIRS
jgi:uracil-DNA glycosylase family 4